MNELLDYHNARLAAAVRGERDAARVVVAAALGLLAGIALAARPRRRPAKMKRGGKPHLRRACEQAKAKGASNADNS